MPRSASAKRVLLIGWDAGDWQIARPLMDAGLMPTLTSMVGGGVWGNLASLEPILSPMLWNSIATGKHADQHGICGFTEPLPDESGIRPVSSRSRRCKALWNILSQNQLRSHVVGWYASHPAEPIRGTMVSNQFEQAVGPLGEPWPIPEGSVHPPSERERLGDLRVHPGEIDAGAILPFVPRAAEANASQRERIGTLRSILAQTSSIHNVATDLLAKDDWDFAAVYYEGIDRLGHAFMEFHPPRMESIDPSDFRLFSQVMIGAYRFHDMMLEVLLKLAGEDTTVLLLSDHGYHNNHLRPDPATAGPVSWHRPIGMMAMQGPGIRRGGRVFGAGLLDTTPTVLRALGLPVGSDMAGRAWAEAWETPLKPHRILTWETVEGDDGRHPGDVEEDPVAARAAMQQLVELGYIDPPNADTRAAVADAVESNTTCLATALMSQGRHAEALDLLEALPPSSREGLPVLIQRTLCLLALKRLDAARSLAEELQKRHPSEARADLFLGVLAAADGDFAEARRCCTRAAERDSAHVETQFRLGRVCLLAGDPAAAEPALRRAIALDPDHANAHNALAQTALELDRPDEAIDFALRAVELLYHFPSAHFHLGEALRRTGNAAAAEKAFRMALKQRGHRCPEASEKLAQTLDTLGRSAEADEQRRIAARETVSRGVSTCSL